MKQRKKFTHNNIVYVCTTNQKVGDSNYEKQVKIHWLGSVILGWNAKNNTPMPEIIEQAKISLNNPGRFTL